MRLSKELELKKDNEIASGYLTCKTCNEKRELYLFHRQIKTNKTYYKDKKCKICITGKEPKLYKTTLEGKIRAPKTFIIKNNIRLSPDAKQFIKRVIIMKGYIDSIEAYKLAHYHIETFGYIERLIVDTELELSVMFKELLEVFKRNKE
jgi:hypothetical protein